MKTKILNFSHHRHFDFKRISMAIEKRGNNHNTRRSESLQALISSNRIELERIVGEHDKPTE